MARFSVCIPVYNGEAFLDDALASVARQTLKDVQVVVSDNASTDGTAQIIDRWESELDIRRIRQPATVPMRDHFNRLLGYVETEAYMVLCHDDYLARADALALAQGALDAHPDVSAVYCDMEYVNERGKRLARRRFGRAGAFAGDETGRRCVATARNLFGIPLAVRRSALGDLRYDDPFLYAMDIDLSWSISRTSPAWHIAEPLIANRYSSQNSTWSMLAAARGEYLQLAKKYGLPTGPLDRLKIAATCLAVAQQRRLFGLYERLSAKASHS
jgi:glycosyltransferase involved in cell wall biosynthesis